MNPIVHPSRRTLAPLLAAAAATAVLLLTLVSAGPAGAAFPGVNGKIAFASYKAGDYEVYSMNADGSGLTNLSLNAAGWDTNPAYSPDGTKIAFTRQSGNNKDIYLMDATGANQVNLTQYSGSDDDASWSPDGTKILFTSYRNGAWDIYVMNADGTGQTNVTSDAGPEGGAAFSPDGSKIAYVEYPNFHNQIYVMDADGSNPIPLTEGTYENVQPTWSPDGSKIAFTTHRGSGNDVYVMNADGSEQTSLTPNTTSSSESSPSWSPDGSKIAFTTSRDGNEEVYVMNADGGTGTNLTKVPDVDNSPSWQTLPSADLVLGLAGGPDVAKVNKPITYTISVANAGISNASHTVVTDVLPPEMRFVSASPSQGACLAPPEGSNGTVTCDLGFLPQGKSATVELVVTIAQRRTTFSNTASVQSAAADPNQTNNAATITTPVK